MNQLNKLCISFLMSLSFVLFMASCSSSKKDNSLQSEFRKVAGVGDGPDVRFESKKKTDNDPPMGPFTIDKVFTQGTVGSIYGHMLKKDFSDAKSELDSHRDSMDPQLGDYFAQWIAIERGKIQLSDVLKSLDKKPNPWIESLIFSRMVRDNQFESVSNEIKRLVSYSRRQAHWAGWMGWMYLSKNQFSLAKYQFTRAFALQGDSSIAWFGLGHIFEREADYVKAEQAYKQAIEKQPWVWTYHERLSIVHLNKNELNRASYHAEAVEKLYDRNSVEALYLRGRIAQLRAQNELALKKYTEVLEKQPNHISALVNSAKILMFIKGRKEDAKTRVSAALKIERRPASTKALQDLSRMIDSTSP